MDPLPALEADDRDQLLRLVNSQIPAAQQDLLNSAKQLEELASSCEHLFLAAETAEDRASVVSMQKEYTIQSLASVAFMIDVMANCTVDLFSLQDYHVHKIEEAVSQLTMHIDINIERGVRKEIGKLSAAKSNRPEQRVTVDESGAWDAHEYRREKFDLCIFDNVGHGQVVVGETKSTSSKSSSSSLTTPVLKLRRQGTFMRASASQVGPPTIRIPVPDIVWNSPPDKCSASSLQENLSNAVQINSRITKPSPQQLASSSLGTWSTATSDPENAWPEPSRLNVGTLSLRELYAADSYV